MHLLFTSCHCTLDPSSGAALATRDLLELLSGRDWECRSLCGPVVDFPQAESPMQLLRDQGIPFEHTPCRATAVPFSLLHYRTGGVVSSIYCPEPPGRSPPGRAEGGAFLALVRRMLQRLQPEVLLTYGGSWIDREAMQLAKQHGCRVVFALHNFAYKDARFFDPVDAVLVPSRFSADYYHDQFGLHCTPIPSPLNWERVRCEPDAERRYVTFINPTPNKGVFIFARIAKELGERRPDIPLLIVEGRGRADWLNRTGLDLSSLSNLHRMPNTPDPRDFYRVSRAILMPSLWNESFGRVAAEAQVNGIPVLASDRGALPEIVDEGGFLFSIPERYTPETRLVPATGEVASWVETIIRLWDDDAFHRRQRVRAFEAAGRWHPEKSAAEHDDFFRWIVAAETVHQRI